MPFYHIQESDVSTEGAFRFRDFDKIRRPALVAFLTEDPIPELMTKLERLQARIQHQICHVLLIHPSSDCSAMRACAASTLGIPKQACAHRDLCQPLLFLTDLRGRLVRQLDINIPYKDLEAQFIEAQSHF